MNTKIISIINIILLMFFVNCSNKQKYNYIFLEELPTDTIAFNQLPQELKEIYQPLIGITFESMAAQDSLDPFCFYNFTKYEIRDSVDTVRGTQNFIYYQFLGAPQRFFFYKDNAFVIYRGIPGPCVFYEKRFIYPLDFLWFFFKVEDSKFISIDLSEYLKE